MAKRKVDIKWYVLNEDFNTRKIILQNVITNELVELIYKHYKNNSIANLNQLENFINLYFRGIYSYRAECEIVVGGLFTKYENFERIDIYKQLEKNLKTITEYINYKMELNLKYI